MHISISGIEHFLEHLEFAFSLGGCSDMVLTKIVSLINRFTWRYGNSQFDYHKIPVLNTKCKQKWDNRWEPVYKMWLQQHKEKLKNSEYISSLVFPPWGGPSTTPICVSSIPCLIFIYSYDTQYLKSARSFNLLLTLFLSPVTVPSNTKVSRSFDLMLCRIQFSFLLVPREALAQNFVFSDRI